MLKSEHFHYFLQKIMRIILYQVFLSLAFIVVVHAEDLHAQKVLDQKLSLNLSDTELDHALTRIESLAKVRFMYNPKIFPSNPKISYRFDEKPLSDVLVKILSPYNVYYEVVHNKIILKKKTTRNIEEISPLGSRLIPLDKSITGKVLDETGEGFPGVTVLLKGSQVGTSTDADGLFSIEIPDNALSSAVLIFSFVGYIPQEVLVGNQSDIVVNLKSDTKSLNEVVVTALGITREKKALSYAVSEVKGSEFTQARENNVANALTGKIAGVNATGMATGPGGSSRIVIRGNGSLNGNNQPLYVINGMPMDNTIPGGGTTSGGGGMNVDRGDGIGGINPDDIESISVLKGGPAAALYGARAANGVILITTKKGRGQKGIGVEINSNVSFENIAVIPKWQYEYGQGVDGQKPTSVTEAKSTGRLSYGAKMDGQPTIQVDGEMHPYSPQKNNLKNFYNTGTNYINSIGFTGGSDNINFRLGLNSTKSNSIVPNSTFSRKIANLNLNASLGKKLSIQTVVQYNLEEAKNRPKVGYADMNPHWATYLVANVVDIRSLAPGYDETTGKEMEWNPVPAAPNPYFVVNKFKNDDDKNRFIGQANIRYDILNNLFVKGSISQDFYSFKSEYVQPTNNAYQPLGTYETRKASSSETNAMLTLNYNGRFFEDLTFTTMLGGNAQRSIYDETQIAGSEFTVPYFYSYTNLATSTTTPTYNKSAINSLFGSMDFGYKGFAYLTLSGRQDWFSVLNPKNNSIFYPSVGGSLILSQAIELPEVISFAKLRGSWAQVGGATVLPYQIYQYYNMQQGGHNGRPVQTLASAQVPNSDLKPLTSTTYEAGIELGFINGRLGLDLTLYNRKTTNDIVTANIAATSGYTSALLNVGELSNKGVELLLTGTPVKKSDFTWDVSYNMAYNVSKIEKLAEGLDYVDVGSGVGGGLIRNALNRPYGTVWGYRKKTDENGNVIFNTASGYALRGDLEEIGNGTPPLTTGITNNFRYKNFSLNVLVDGKFGSIVYSNLYQYAYRFGLPQETLPGRETGITVEGVTPEGTPYTKTWTKEQVDTYYDNDKNYTAMFMFNNDFIKLRQVVLSYNIPLGKLKIQSASVSLVARNLAILYKDKKNQYFDPESGYTSTNAQGLEAFGVPRTRSMGVNVMVKF
ncbi:SusC/RagA family TonB-linked outer membrane protein [Marinilongibacter aquaticus]|uniref:SusC/RagA family TonB-linked outer membrane protein n=1 Tax=Marinilongibacter aquaticus TaxID=2975157 RepID=UPI0021BD6ED2|nr:SusC/RagA family TonB-linked outer membrane protein [Marinilongibacter aquaticus]UBM59388.1 SusC/RagA family TonB-linked outer membrane protein [Marinilongibacter aquaticus]